MSRLTRGLLCVVALGGLCCASSQEFPQASHPGRVPVDQLPGELLARHRVAFSFGQSTGALEVVLQVHCGEVVVVGLGPMRTPIFSIRQRGDAVETWSRQPWPFPPERLLLDVHRIFLYPIATPSRADGAHALQVGGVAYQERWASGRLVERWIPGGDGRGARIFFETAADGGSEPGRIRFADEELDYRLEIDVREYRRGTCKESGDASRREPVSAPGETRASGGIS